MKWPVVIEVFKSDDFWRLKDGRYTWGEYSTQLLALKHAVNLANSSGEGIYCSHAEVKLCQENGVIITYWTYGIDTLPLIFKNIPKKLSSKKFLGVWDGESTGLKEAYYEWIFEERLDNAAKSTIVIFKGIDVDEDVYVNNRNDLPPLKIIDSHFKRIYINQSLTSELKFENTFVEKIVIVGSTLAALEVEGHNNYSINVSGSNIEYIHISNGAIKNLELLCVEVDRLHISDTTVGEMKFNETEINSLYCEMSDIKSITVTGCIYEYIQFAFSEINNLLLKTTKCLLLEIYYSKMHNLSINSSEISAIEICSENHTLND